jgi:hypothetical protein
MSASPSKRFRLNARGLIVPLLVLVVAVVAWRSHGWSGIALVATGTVTWILVHLSRMMRVIRRAGNRPLGWCPSAVMLNAKLKRGFNLMHVIAMTSAIGEALSPENEEPEIFRWTDDTGSHVTCTFRDGRLAEWALFRPPEAPGAPPVK